MRAMFVMAVTLLMLLPTFASLADEKKLEFTKDTKNSLFLYEREKTVFTVECNGIGEGKVNVSIERNGTTYAYGITNSEGKVEITLPNVTYSSPFTVKAFKEGYTGDSFTIWILEKSMLYISTQRIVEEEKEFEVNGLGGVMVDNFFTNQRDDPRWQPLLEKAGVSADQLAAIEFNVTLPN